MQMVQSVKEEDVISFTARDCLVALLSRQNVHQHSAESLWLFASYWTSARSNASKCVFSIQAKVSYFSCWQR